MAIPAQPIIQISKDLSSLKSEEVRHHLEALGKLVQESVEPASEAWQAKVNSSLPEVLVHCAHCGNERKLNYNPDGNLISCMGCGSREVRKKTIQAPPYPGPRYPEGKPKQSSSDFHGTGSGGPR